ncbi:MAG: hypothetical protein WHT07_00335 [Desulfobaccales bacterium]
MWCFRRQRGLGAGGRLLAWVLILSLLPGCPVTAAQVLIPAAYALTGLCIALLVSPTPWAAAVGLALGALLGAAVYNNSLKRHFLEPRPPRTAPER